VGRQRQRHRRPVRPAGRTARHRLGAEHRDQSGRFDPDPTVAAGLGSDIPALPTKGSFNVDEVYGELRAPLLANTPFFQKLELSFAARYSDYSTSGSKTTIKAGADWKPVHDLLFRGSWAQGFRAPSIGELFGTPSRFDQEIVDPCSAVGGQIPAAVRPIASPTASPPTAATSRPTRSFR
jgi:iron complex outermembrane receptor protein